MCIYEAFYMFYFLFGKQNKFSGVNLGPHATSKMKRFETTVGSL